MNYYALVDQLTPQLSLKQEMIIKIKMFKYILSTLAITVDFFIGYLKKAAFGLSLFFFGTMVESKRNAEQRCFALTHVPGFSFFHHFLFFSVDWSSTHVWVFFRGEGMRR